MEEQNHTEILLYSTADGGVRIEILFEGETFWTTQKKMAELFGVDVRTVNEHLQNIFKSEELAPVCCIDAELSKHINPSALTLFEKISSPRHSDAHGYFGSAFFGQTVQNGAAFDGRFGALRPRGGG